MPQNVTSRPVWRWPVFDLREIGSIASSVQVGTGPLSKMMTKPPFTFCLSFPKDSLLSLNTSLSWNLSLWRGMAALVVVGLLSSSLFRFNMRRHWRCIIQMLHPNVKVALWGAAEVTWSTISLGFLNVMINTEWGLSLNVADRFLQLKV